MRRAIFAAACAVVIAVLAAIAGTVGRTLEWNPNPATANYNLLVQGFRAGQLNLNRPVPAGFARLPDPYDPVANSPYRHAPDNLHDTSYYQGKLYLYYGAVPALVLLWPWAALTGHYLFPRVAVTIFCAVGFLAAVGILLAAPAALFSACRGHRRPRSACARARAGDGNSDFAAQRPGLCELPIGCGYAFVMLALAALWGALHEPARRGPLAGGGEPGLRAGGRLAAIASLRRGDPARALGGGVAGAGAGFRAAFAGVATARGFSPRRRFQSDLIGFERW